MLNYAYAVLESEVRAQVLAAGLDPTIGYLHGSYRGKHALVFDLMEPLRPVVDRSVLQSVQDRALEPGDFTMWPDGICRLNPGLAACLVRSQQDALKTQCIVNHSIEALSAIA
jgi:CRISPR-associated endonuclease Cas1